MTPYVTRVSARPDERISTTDRFAEVPCAQATIDTHQTSRNRQSSAIYHRLTAAAPNQRGSPSGWYLNHSPQWGRLARVVTMEGLKSRTLPDGCNITGQAAARPRTACHWRSPDTLSNHRAHPPQTARITRRPTGTKCLPLLGHHCRCPSNGRQFNEGRIRRFVAISQRLARRDATTAPMPATRTATAPTPTHTPDAPVAASVSRRVCSGVWVTGFCGAGV